MDNWAILDTYTYSYKSKANSGVLKDYYATKRQQIFQLIENSTPVQIAGRTWIIRVMYHNEEDEFYIDIREFNSCFVEDSGISIPLKGISTLFDILWKLEKKYLNRKKKRS